MTVAELRAGCVVAQAELDVLYEAARELEEGGPARLLNRARELVLEAWQGLGELHEGDAYYLPDRVAQP